MVKGHGGDCFLNLADIVNNISSKSINPNKLRIDIISNSSLINSAVLVPLVIDKGQVALLYTLRTSSLDRHSGQVSFPGGIIEKGELSAVETAIRETEEEIGIQREDIQIVGQFRPFNTSTGYLVFPVIGVIKSLENLKKNASEVDRIFCIPISWLCAEGHSRKQKFKSDDGNIRNLWYFDLYEGELLWGLTAKITKDLIKLIQK